MQNEWGTSNPTEAYICRGLYGIPKRVDRIKGLGNAIVPQIAYVIFEAIKATGMVANNKNDNTTLADKFCECG